jgi:hydrogenase maturation factor
MRFKPRDVEVEAYQYAAAALQLAGYPVRSGQLWVGERPRPLQVGDWLVVHVGGHLEIVPDEVFRRVYVPAPTVLWTDPE